MDDAQLQEMFNSIDVNGDGKVGVDELKGILHNLNGSEFNKETLSLLVGMFNQNNCGFLAYKEFVSLFNYVNHWLEVFIKYDKNGTGQVSSKNFVKALNGIGYKFPKSMVLLMLKKFGRAKDLELDHFIRICSILKRLDENFQAKGKPKGNKNTFEFYDFIQSSIEACF